MTQPSLDTVDVIVLIVIIIIVIVQANICITFKKVVLTKRSDFCNHSVDELIVRSLRFFSVLLL